MTLRPPPLLLLALVGCGADVPSAPRPVGDVVAWAKGSGHRLVPGEGVSAREILYNDAGAVQTLGACIPGAVSMVPAPAGDSRIFLLRSGQLVVGPLPPIDASPAHATWRLDGPAPTLTRLLAARAVGDALEILALGHIDDSAAVTDDYYALQVTPGNDVVAAASAAGRPELADRIAFYETYPVTRCREPGRDCMLIGTFHERSFIDVEPTPDAAPQPLHELDGELLDAAWVPGQGRSFIALTRCDPAADPA